MHYHYHYNKIILFLARTDLCVLQQCNFLASQSALKLVNIIFNPFFSYKFGLFRKKMLPQLRTGF